MNYSPRFDFEEERKSGVMDKIGGFFIALGPRYVFGALALVLVILGAIIFGLYPQSQSGSGNVPIIRADAQPFKVQPDDPGGMTIANRGSTIFEAMSGTDADAGVENLLAANETEDPMPRSQLFAGLNTDVEEEQTRGAQQTMTTAPPQPDAIQNTIEDIARGTNTTEQSQKMASAQMTEDEAQAETIQSIEPAAGAIEEVRRVVPEAAPTPTPVPTPAETPERVTPAVDMGEAASLVNQLEPAAGAAPPKAAIPGGDFYVQVASVKNRGGTEGEWSKLKAKYTALEGFKYRIIEANLGDKGTFYRIQAGPTTRSYANDVCTKIKAVTPGGCLVVKK